MNAEFNPNWTKVGRIGRRPGGDTAPVVSGLLVLRLLRDWCQT